MKIISTFLITLFTLTSAMASSGPSEVNILEEIKGYHSRIQEQRLGKNDHDPELRPLYERNAALVKTRLTDRFPERLAQFQNLQTLAGELMEKQAFSNNTFYYVHLRFSDLMIAGDSYEEETYPSVDTLLELMLRQYVSPPIDTTDLTQAEIEAALAEERVKQQRAPFSFFTITDGYYLPLVNETGLFSFRELNVSFAFYVPLIAVPTGDHLNYDGLDAYSNELTWHDGNHFAHFSLDNDPYAKEQAAAKRAFARHVIPRAEVLEDQNLNEKLQIALFWMVHEDMFFPQSFPDNFDIDTTIVHFKERLKSFFDPSFKMQQTRIQKIEFEFMDYIKDVIDPSLDFGPREAPNSKLLLETLLHYTDLFVDFYKTQIAPSLSETGTLSAS